MVELDTKMNRQLFRFSSIKDDDVKVAFYTGFPTSSCLKAFFEPAASDLRNKKEIMFEQEKKLSAIV